MQDKLGFEFAYRQGRSGANGTSHYEPRCQCTGRDAGWRKAHNRNFEYEAQGYARTKPSSRRSTVDFPAPFGPSRPRVVPAESESETSSRAGCVPYDFETWLSSRTGIGTEATRLWTGAKALQDSTARASVCARPRRKMTRGHRARHALQRAGCNALCVRPSAGTLFLAAGPRSIPPALPSPSSPSAHLQPRELHGPFVQP